MVKGIISKGVANTRAREYYDIYILMKFQKRNIDIKTLKEAIINTFNKRETTYYLENINNQISEIENSDDLKEIWNNYKNKFSYAKDISFQETIDVIKEITNDF